MEGATQMLGQIWSTLTRKPQSTPGALGAQLDPIVKYRLALYLTTTTVNGSSDATAAVGGTYFRKLGAPEGR
jgi:hypothetical protein